MPEVAYTVHDWQRMVEENPEEPPWFVGHVVSSHYREGLPGANGAPYWCPNHGVLDYVFITAWCPHCVEALCDSCGEVIAAGQSMTWYGECEHGRSWEGIVHDNEECGYRLDDSQESDCQYDCPTHEVPTRYSYDYKPAFRFQRLPNEPMGLMLGVELETEPPDDGDEGYEILRDALEAVEPLFLTPNGESQMYATADGSLLAEGLELTSHPASLAYHLADDGMRWREILRRARREGLRSHDGGHCGLHVHVSVPVGDSYRVFHNLTAAPLRTLHNRLVLLAGGIVDQLVTLSRRTDSALGQWASMPAWDARGRSALPPSRSKYQAIAHRGDTIEFRLWRGTLRPETLFACLEATVGLVSIAQQHGAGWCARARWSDVRPLLLDGTRYLANYMEEREV